MKPRFTILPWRGIYRIAELMTAAAVKYPGPKWQELTTSDHIDAACRHLSRYMSGDVIDPEYGMTHLVHAACRLVMALAQEPVNDGPMNLNYMDVYVPTYDGQEKL